MTTRVRRLGVAVELPEPYSTLLAEARRRTGDPAANDMAPHVTLVPPVDITVPLDQVVALLASAAERVPPFSLHLRGTGTFRPVSPVVFVAVAAGISELELLTRRIRVAPLDPVVEFPYHPHVTVAQNVSAANLDAVYQELAGFEAKFEVETFQLFEYESADVPPCPDGRKWAPILEFRLGHLPADTTSFLDRAGQAPG